MVASGAADHTRCVGRQDERGAESVGEKGNLPVDDPLLALDSMPIDAIKGSPETVNAWLDTYLKYREVRETSRAADAAETIADGQEPPASA